MSKSSSVLGGRITSLEGKKRKTIFSDPKAMMCIMLPFFNLRALEFISPELSQIFDILRIVSFVIILGTYINNRKISKFILVLFFFEFVILLSTILNNGDFWKLCRNCGNVIGFCMFTEMCIKENYRIYFKCIYHLCFVLTLANFVLLIIYPDGLAVNYIMSSRINFIGSDNELAPYLIPFMAMACINSLLNGKKMTFMSFIMIVCISATIIITWSGTGVVGWFVMMLYILFVYKRKITSFFNSAVLFIAFLCAEIGIVFLRLQNHFSHIINDILRKDLTLSARTILWDSALRLIKEKPLLGYGSYFGTGLIWRNNWYYTAHNTVLEVTLQGGIIALIFFLALFIIAAIPLYKYRSNYISGIISAAIFSMLVMMLTEVHLGHFMLYWALTAATCIPDIIRQLDMDTGKNVA